MSERKVLNKYYPPDFDPSKIPRMKLARNRQYTVRLMAPFNMRCKTCGEYIYKGKKFNARKEDVEGDDYLGIRIYRFYIKCTRCLQEISFKTDPKNTDYEIEAGATRNFMALKLAEEQAQREEDEEKEEEATNPMKLLEKRTLQSKQELELLESLEELKDLNRRQQAIDYDQMLEQFDTGTSKQRTEKEQEEYDEECIKSIFGKKFVAEEEIVELDEKEANEPPRKVKRTNESTKDSDKIQFVADKEKSKGNQGIKSSEISFWSENTEKSINASSSSRKNLLGIVKRKTNVVTKTDPCSTVTSVDAQGTETVADIKSSETSFWSENTEKSINASSSSRKNLLGIVKRKTNVVTKSDPCSTVTSVEKDTSTCVSESKNVDANTSQNRNNSVGNSHSGLSLLGAYSGSSDNDSD